MQWNLRQLNRLPNNCWASDRIDPEIQLRYRTLTLDQEGKLSRAHFRSMRCARKSMVYKEEFAASSRTVQTGAWGTNSSVWRRDRQNDPRTYDVEGPGWNSIRPVVKMQTGYKEDSVNIFSKIQVNSHCYTLHVHGMYFRQSIRLKNDPYKRN